MYNIEVKSKFLDSLPTQALKKMFTSIFKRTEPYEAELDKDILDFNAVECSKLLMLLNPKSTSHVGSLKSQFNKYINWGMQVGLASKNYWVLVPHQSTDFAKHSFSSRYVRDVEELTRIVDTALVVPYDKYLIYLLYMGIMGENFSELSLIKDEDVDKIKRTITTNRRTFKIIEPLYAALMSSEYYKEAKKRDEDSKYIIKPYKTIRLLREPIGYQHVFRVFNRLNNEYNKTDPVVPKQLTPMTTWRSGLFYELYQSEQIKGELVTEDYNVVSEIYDNKNTYSSYLREYELYKELFWGGVAFPQAPPLT